MHWYGVRKRIILLEIRKKEIDRYILQELISLLNKLEGSLVATKLKQDLLPKVTNYSAVFLSYFFLFSSVRSSNSHPDLLLTHHHQQHPLFQI